MAIKEAPAGLEKAFPGPGIEAKRRQTTFVIRANHLKLVAPVASGSRTVDEQVGREVFKLQKYRDRAWYRIEARRRKRLAADEIGNTPEQEKTYREAAISFLDDFMNLDPNHRVKVVDGQNDNLYKGYANGEYNSRYFNIYPFRIMYDPVFIDVFQQAATMLNLGDEIETVTELAHFSNRKKPKETKSLVTTVGVVKTVLSDPWFLEEMHQRIRP